MRSDIKVSFVDNEEEDLLYDRIVDASKYIGKAKWFKIAAREKLERDNVVKTQPVQQSQQINHFNNQQSVIDPMEQFYKPQ